MSDGAVYQERLSRIRKAINLEPVDQVPVIYIGGAFSPRYMGVSMGRYCTDMDFAVETTLAAVKRLGDIDGLNGLPGARIHVMLTLLWLSHVDIPGRELPDDSLWQVHEAEVMKADEYDTIIDKGWTAFRNAFLPRVLDMAEFDVTMAWIRDNSARVAQLFRDEGFVTVRGGITSIPFEFLCGARSMQKFFLDLYRTPEKVKAAMDVMAPEIIQGAVAQAKASGAIGVWIGGWRAASALIAPKIWDKFVFPYYQQIVEAMAENGIVSILHLDQDWTRDLARFKELPAKKCLLNPDGMTDIRKAKEILGHHMAIMGDVPASLFATGTPDDIYKYVRDLVRDVGPTGLLLCPGCDAPINTKPENMEAFVAAGRKFGVANSGA
jgi:uroporphyrinogen-III decarboxylase